MTNTGKIVQVIGPVVDIRFHPDHLPTILNEIDIVKPDGKMVAEVAQHIGDDIVRCIAMSSTDGLVRGMECIDTGAPIEVPVGNEVLGRMFNVLGEPIDGLGDVKATQKRPIHREAPSFAEQRSSSEILETGIKVIDLLCPYSKGGKIGLFGGQAPSVYPEFCEFLIKSGIDSMSVNPDTVKFTKKLAAQIEQRIMLDALTGRGRQDVEDLNW